MGRMADLARLLTQMPRDQALEAAAAAGYAHVAQPRAKDDASAGTDESSGSEGSRPGADDQHPRLPETESMPFWRIVSHEQVALDERGEPVDAGAAFDERDGGDLRTLPQLKPFCSWVELWPRLYALIADRIAGQAIDTARLTRQLSQCQAVTAIPRRTVTRWPARLLLWADANSTSVPLWLDRNLIAARLTRLCEQVRLGGPRHRRPGESVLRLGALPVGQRRLGERVRSEGKRATALTFDDAPRRGWETTPWQGEPAEYGTSESRAHRLRVMLSPIVWVHLGLLREIRELLPPTQADIRTELDVWNGEGVRVAVHDGLRFDPAAAAVWQAEFKALPETLQADIHARISTWRKKAPDELRHVEALLWAQLDAKAPALFDAHRARDFIQGASEKVRRGSSPDLQGYARAASEHLLELVDRDESLKPAVSRLWYAGHRGMTVEVPPQVDPTQASAVLDPSGRRTVRLVHSSRGLILQPDAASTAGVTIRAIDWASGGTWRVAVDDEPAQQMPAHRPVGLAGSSRVRIDTGFERLELQATPQPDWAVDLGRDRQGAFADALIDGTRYRLRWQIGTGWVGPEGLGADDFGVFEDVRIADVLVRFRLIPAGKFMMGSPDDEQGRWEDEGPQHEVTLTEPFWLAEAPVTQALWQAVTGENPSHFKGAERPVETVSWDDAIQFIDKVERAHPGLALRLPTEAQWEYACRAGTTTPRYDELDAVAWYTGNSGGETLPVKQKQPNAWGLYDMLGNVWEWSADYWQDSYQPGAATNPTGPEEGSRRVYRGGSWGGSARLVRAAYRSWNPPGNRSRYLGVRLSRGPAPSARSAERAEPASTHQGDPPARSDGAEGQARSAGGGASPEGVQAAEREQTKRSIFSRIFERKKGDDEP